MFDYIMINLIQSFVAIKGIFIDEKLFIKISFIKKKFCFNCNSADILKFLIKKRIKQFIINKVYILIYFN